eukprot:326118_1
MSSLFCSMSCARPANTQTNNGSCCQKCSNTKGSKGNTNNHTTQCDKLYNEYLITQFTQNAVIEQWACCLCTFQNQSFRTKCQICDNPKPQNKQMKQQSNIDTDVIMMSPLKQQKQSRKRKHEQMYEDDDSDIVILDNNNNNNKKRRKINENTNNLSNDNIINNDICKPKQYHKKSVKEYFIEEEEEEEEIIDPRLQPMKAYHNKRLLMIDIPGDYVIDYDLMDSIDVKLSCFYHEKSIRMEQNLKFNKYKEEIKKLNYEINKTPKEVFNYKINEYYVHENTQIIQMQTIRNSNKKNKLPFTEDNKVLLFCSCCLTKIGSETDKKNKLTQQQKAMIEMNRLAALERLKKNGIKIKPQIKTNKSQIELETLMEQKFVLYGVTNEITIDNKENNKQIVNILIRIRKYNKYLTEYDSDITK